MDNEAIMIFAISGVSLAHLQRNLRRLPLSQEECQRCRYSLTILLGEINHWRYVGDVLHGKAEIICEDVGKDDLNVGTRSHERLEEGGVLVEYSIHVDEVGLVVVAPVLVEFVGKVHATHCYFMFGKLPLDC